jgi:hypothetical protein
MTLADLNRSWQELRTKALGRSGFEQNVSPQLASRFTQALAGWDQWYANAGPLSDLFGSTDPEVLAWLQRYRDLAFDMRREGLQVAELAPTAGEQITEAAGDVGKAVAAVAAVAFAAWLWINRKRRA